MLKKLSVEGGKLATGAALVVYPAMEYGKSTVPQTVVLDQTEAIYLTVDMHKRLEELAVKKCGGFRIVNEVLESIDTNE